MPLPLPRILLAAAAVSLLFCTPATARQRSSSKPPPARTLTVGIDGGYGSWDAAEVELRRRLKATVTRHQFLTDAPVDAQDDLVYKAAQIGTRIHALLGTNELPAAGAYRDFVVAFIKRYGRGGSFWAAHPELDAARFHIRSVELGNEPYFGAMTKERYADTIRPALEEVSRLRLPVTMIPAARVLGSELTDVPWLGATWIEALYARIPRLNDLIGGLAVHPYWYGHTPSEKTQAAQRPFTRLQIYRDRLNAHGGQSERLYVTEYGQSTARCSDCVSESRQAADLKTMIEAAEQRADWNIAAVFVYQLRDLNPTSAPRDHGFGIARRDGSAKPAWSVVAGAIRRHP